MTIVFCLCLGLNQTQAEIIIIEITGEVTSASGSALPSTIEQGDTFTGTYTYDSSTEDSGGGHYIHNAPYGITISLGGYEFMTAPIHVGKFEISILDNYTPPFGNMHDEYWVQSFENSPLSSGVMIDSISWELLDYSHTEFSSSVLPVTSPILSHWDFNRLEIYGPENSLYIRGTVMQAELIPEPTTIVLMLMGVFLSKRRR
jgi:hypothetical protein